MRARLKEICPLAGLLIVCANTSAQSETALPGDALAGPGLASLGLNLLLVLAIIAVCAWLLSRGRQHLAAGSSDLRIVASKAIGSRERVVVIEVAGQQVLVGVTSSAISHLHTLATPLATTADGSDSTNSFATKLRNVVAQRKQETVK